MGKISQFIHSDMQKKVAALKYLTLKLHTTLPSQFVSQCQIADYSAQQLIIAVTSSIWSHQLRYYIPLIQKNFEQQSIKIIITPALIDLQQVSPKKPIKHLDNQSAEIIEKSADTIDDPALKTSLKKLSMLRKDRH